MKLFPSKASLPSRTFVSIPELDEESLHLLGTTGATAELALSEAPTTLRPPTHMSKNLAQAMTKAMLRASADSPIPSHSPNPPSHSPTRGPSPRNPHHTPRLHAPDLTMDVSDSDALARLDYDTSQSLTHCSGEGERAPTTALSLGEDPIPTRMGSSRSMPNWPPDTLNLPPAAATMSPRDIRERRSDGACSMLNGCI
jgi:hypothetical protein